MTLPSRICGAALVLSLSLATAPPAAAQSAPTTEQQAQARTLFQRAEASKQRGDTHASAGEEPQARAAYGEAARDYSAAFKLVPHPGLMFNLAQMRRLRGEGQLAIRAYQTYLVLEPQGARADQARAFIAQITLDFDASNAAPPDDDTSADGDNDASTGTEAGEIPASDAGEIPTPEDDTAAPAPVAESPTAAAPAPAPAPAPAIAEPAPATPAPAATSSGGYSGLSIAAIASTAALGALGVGLGVKFGLDAGDAADALSDKPVNLPWNEADRRRVRQGEDAERNMLIALSIGGAALIASGVLVVLGGADDGAESRERGSASLVPSLMPGGFGLALTGDFD